MLVFCWVQWLGQPVYWAQVGAAPFYANPFLEDFIADGVHVFTCFSSSMFVLPDHFTAPELSSNNASYYILRRKVIDSFTTPRDG